MNTIEQKISDASQKYYTNGTSDLSDDEFDAMLEELRSSNPSSPLLNLVGHGYDVKFDSTPGNKYPHRYGIAGSLTKCRNWKELDYFLTIDDVCCSLKLDGLSVVLYYYEGSLYRALTRGDGNIGIDITSKVLKIFPGSVNADFTGSIRGELLMTYDNFDDYRKLYPNMKNPRNTTAGIINSKSLDGIEYVSLIVYTIVGSENISFDTYHNMHNQLIDWFGQDNVVPCTDPFSLSESTFISKMNDLKDEWYDKDYPADGIVITSNNINHDTPYLNDYTASAFKFPSELKTSVVKDVQWNMSKTHYAIPKIQIEPITLAGTTVEFCTGYNAQWVKDNNVGPGALVTVEKRGEIIPNIQDVVVECVSPSMIEFCPDCGSKLIWDGVHLKCPDSSCRNAVEQDTIIWITTLVPTDNLGDTLILKFLNELELDELSIENIMNFDHKLAEDMNSVQWNTFAKMFNTLVSGDTKFKLVDAVKALNIPRLGSITALRLSMFSSDVRLLKDCASGRCNLNETFWSLLEAKVGNANTQSIRNNLSKFARLDFIEDRIIWDVISSEPKGKVAITGKLSVKRSDFEKELGAKGWILGDVSKDTRFLITDDPSGNSSKNKKADKLGVLKITEEEFRSKYL